MKIQNWPLKRLKPFPNNPRIISETAVEKVAASIREYGFKQPIVVDKDGEIIVGHNRLMAVRRWMKFTGKEAVHTETEKKWRSIAKERGIHIGE